MTRSCWGLVTRARLSCGRPRKLCHQQCTSSANMCASRRVWRYHSSQPLQRLTFRTSVIPGTQASSRSWQPCLWPPPRLENTPGRAGSISKNTPSNGCHLAPPSIMGVKTKMPQTSQRGPHSLQSFQHCWPNKGHGMVSNLLFFWEDVGWVLAPGRLCFMAGVLTNRDLYVPDIMFGAQKGFFLFNF